jgi:peptidoglycan/xylan/chitin deacetylase (PgdA/CDA1 family)
MKKFALEAMRLSGMSSLARALSARMARILMYHNFSATGATDPNALDVEGIRRQFTYLRAHFRVVPLLQLAERLASGGELDRHTVALTIDDGRRNCFEFLFPLLKEFKLPATFFVVSSFIQGQDWIWTDKLLWLSEQPQAPEELTQGKLDSVFGALNRLRPEDRNARIEAMAKRAGVSLPREAPPKYAPCSWSELAEMAASGVVEIGSHTVTHPILSSISDEESWNELTQSRAQIAAGIGREIRFFCFPNGMPEDYRPAQVRQVAEAGYACSVVAQFGMVGPGSDRYRLPRMGAATKTSTAEFSAYVDGGTYYKEKLRAWFGAG